MRREWIYLVIAVAAMVVSALYTEHLEKERDTYRNNAEALSSDIERYKVADSLSAARTRSLELSLDEFKRFRAADAELIRQLQQKNRDLAAVNDIQAQTIIEMAARPRDTIITVDSILVPAKAVHCGDEWYDFDGLLTDDAFTGHLTCRDSIIVSESVEHARFLGFLWKTSKVKNRQLDVVSLNPHTQIEDVYFIVIED